MCERCGLGRPLQILFLVYWLSSARRTIWRRSKRYDLRHAANVNGLNDMLRAQLAEMREL
jgi:hypothetical protein